MKFKLALSLFAFFVGLFCLLLITPSASASHSWGDPAYHWARTNNPFTLKLGDNFSPNWDPYLAEASNDWSASNILDTTIVTGGSLANPKRCRATSGRIEVCNAKYGFNGWLGIAQIWISGTHITQGVAKMNDSYFNTQTYNTPAWRRLVVCQEIAHAFGLDHQDENFNNANLGTCMDYTSNPAGPPSNEYPNAHDYEQLGLIYAHLDSFATIQSGTQRLPFGQGIAASVRDADYTDRSEWGRELKNNAAAGLYERDLENGVKLFTHVFFAQD